MHYILLVYIYCIIQLTQLPGIVIKRIPGEQTWRSIVFG